MSNQHEQSIPKTHLLFFVTEDWYFCSHRFELASAALASGYHVTVVTQINEFGEKIKNQGFNLIPLEIDRKSGSLTKELKLLLQLRTIFKIEKPDIIHHIAIKPILYGGVAAYLAGVSRNVYTLAGLGYAFTSKQKKARIFCSIIQILFGFLFKRNCRVIFQNPDNYNLLVEKDLIKPEKAVLIRGSGVDIDKFRSAHDASKENARKENASNEFTVVLASRMVWEKGIGEFVEAARILLAQGVKARFVLVGASDIGNRNAVSEQQLKQWNNEGIIEWQGASRNMSDVFSRAHIVTLPSAYGEGVPKVLLEAAASGLPIVTTDMPGCREIVKEGVNGFLVPKEDAEKLAEALKKLIDDPALCRVMGNNGRKMVAEEFSVDRVVNETLDVYQSLLAEEV
jgi:glycosyltransferase involved in cell wall biosynthesis